MLREKFWESVERINQILDDEGADALSAPEPGTNYVGFNIQHTTDAVNQVWGADWRFEIAGDPSRILKKKADGIEQMRDVHNLEVCVGVYLFFDDLPAADGIGSPGAWVLKAMEYGGGRGDRDETDAIKIAAGDALKKALSRLGVGRKIYRKEVDISDALAKRTSGNVSGNSRSGKKQTERKIQAAANEQSYTPQEPTPAPPADPAPQFVIGPMSEQDINMVVTRMKQSVLADGQPRFTGPETPKLVMDFIKLATGLPPEQYTAGRVTEILALLPGGLTGNRRTVDVLLGKLNELDAHAAEMRDQPAPAAPAEEERPWNPGGEA